MEISGKIIAALQPKSGVSQRSGNTWMSADYVLEIPGQYPRKCVFTVFGEDRIKQFNLQMGETVTVSIEIDAHEYNGRWFNEVRAFNVVRPQMQQGQQAQQFAQPYPQQPMQQAAPFPQQAPVQQPVQQQMPPQGQQLPFPPAQ